MKILATLFLAICVFLVPVSWCVNLYQFCHCDFSSDYKCEVIHGVGILPVASPVTVWFGTDE